MQLECFKVKYFKIEYLKYYFYKVLFLFTKANILISPGICKKVNQFLPVLNLSGHIKEVKEK